MKAVSPEITSSAKIWNTKLNLTKKLRALEEHMNSGTTPTWLSSHLMAIKKLSPIYDNAQLLIDVEKRLLDRHIDHAMSKVDEITQKWNDSLTLLEGRIRDIRHDSPDKSSVDIQMVLQNARESITSKTASMKAKQLRDEEKARKRKEAAEVRKTKMETDELVTKKDIRKLVNQVLNSKNDQRPNPTRPPRSPTPHPRGRTARSRSRSRSRNEGPSRMAGGNDRGGMKRSRNKEQSNYQGNNQRRGRDSRISRRKVSFQ